MTDDIEDADSYVSPPIRWIAELFGNFLKDAFSALERICLRTWYTSDGGKWPLVWRKLVYSHCLFTFGFSVHKANDCLENMAPDNELVFEIGGKFFGRGNISKTDVTVNSLVSYWSPFEGISVMTVLTPASNGYGLRHTITSNTKCTAYSCGFAISQDESDYEVGVAVDCANIMAGGTGCEVEGGPGLIINASPNTNLLHPRTGIPAVRHEIGVGTTEVRAFVMIFG